MKLTYNKFSCMSMKARIDWVQQHLLKLGYLAENDIIKGKRTKPFIKAIIKFQKDNNLGTNGEINENEFNILNNI